MNTLKSSKKEDALEYQEVILEQRLEQAHHRLQLHGTARGRRMIALLHRKLQEARSARGRSYNHRYVREFDRRPSRSAGEVTNG
jgi:hypothetical protein